MNNTTPEEIEERELDPAAEAQEDSLVDQIKSLLAQLVQGEAAELGSGSPATESLRALVGVICALDWWEEIDEAEDASGDEEMSEMAPDMEMNSARSTVEAREVFRSLTA
jgi:oligoribonuclease NrnB/cAMP/cGMP phosphodiesterase (DHH superfamily)